MPKSYKPTSDPLELLRIVPHDYTFKPRWTRYAATQEEAESHLKRMPPGTYAIIKIDGSYRVVTIQAEQAPPPPC